MVEISTDQARIDIGLVHRFLTESSYWAHAIVEHPDLQGLRVFMLRTSDAHGLYAQFGFQPVERPEDLMSRGS